MRRRTTGQYRTVSTAGERFRAFIPKPLPPKPALQWSPQLRLRFDEALLAVGRLDASTALLPNASLLLYSFVRKEAVLSSQIEGTQSSLADLLLYEIAEEPGVPVEDAREVSRYVESLDLGLKKLRGGFPLCMRLLCDMHKVLMSHVRGRDRTPGEIRRSQVWIGGSRPGTAVFVPPPIDALPDALKHFERFLNDEPEQLSPLIKAGLAHVQFETIHPFLDGNGRIGRLLIVLQLIADGVLREPMLYPSLFFKQHRPLYYELLNAVRTEGDWERWLEFFAEGIEATATQGAATAHTLLELVNEDRDRVAAIGRAATSALVVHHALQRQPIASAGALVKATGLTAATVNKSLAHLVNLGIITELTNRQRGRVFSYSAYVEELMAE